MNGFVRGSLRLPFFLLQSIKINLGIVRGSLEPPPFSSFLLWGSCFIFLRSHAPLGVLLSRVTKVPKNTLISSAKEPTQSNSCGIYFGSHVFFRGKLSSAFFPYSNENPLLQPHTLWCIYIQLVLFKAFCFYLYADF